MKLSKLLEKLEYTVLAGNTDMEISTLVYDSRKVQKDSVFVCISGSVRDAHEFIPDVVKNGAAAVIVEKDVTPVDGVTYMALEPATDNPDDEYVILKIAHDEESGEDILVTIDDDDEFDRIADMFEDEFMTMDYDAEDDGEAE